MTLLRFIRTLAARDDAVLITDRRGIVVHLNLGCERGLGVTRQLARGRPLRELVAVARHAPTAEHAHGHLGTLGGIWRRVQPDGWCVEFEASMRPFVDAAGCATHHVYTVRTLGVRDARARQHDGETPINRKPMHADVAEPA
jgi:PAS domain S-box-containing protein